MKTFGLIVTLLLLFSFLPGIIGCTSPTPTTPTTPTSITTPTTPTTPTIPTTGFKPIKLKYADYRVHKPGSFGTIHEMTPWMRSMETLSNGRIVIEAFPNGSLLSLQNGELGTAQGVTDFGYGTRVVAGTLPMHDVLALPPLSGDTTAVENLMIDWFFLWDRLQKDEKAMNIIRVAPLNLHASLFITAKKPIRTVTDIKGVTLLSTNKWVIRLGANLGATMLAISNLDGYDALAKGMVDGGVWNWEGPFQFGWVDTFKPGYYVDAGGVVRAGGSTNAYMNLQKYNSLPADLREIVDFVSWRWGAVYFAAKIDGSVQPFMKEAEKRGIQYIVWSDEEKAKLAKEKTKIIDAWIAEMENNYKRGAEAAEVFKMYDDAAKKYVPAAWIPVQPALGGTQAEWDSVYGPGSTWGVGWKAYPNQTGLHTLEGNEFKPWPK